MLTHFLCSHYCYDLMLSINLRQSHYTPWRRRGKRSYSSTHSFLTSVLDGSEWSASRPGPHFAPGERTPCTHWTGSWVGPRAGLDTEARGKILLSLWRVEPRSPGRPVRSQTLYWLSYPGCAMLFIKHSNTAGQEINKYSNWFTNSMARVLRKLTLAQPTKKFLESHWIRGFITTLQNYAIETYPKQINLVRTLTSHPF
jgi:hypothetical protein